MLKICAFLLMMPLAVMAKDPCTQASCEKVFHVRENHPKLQGLEIELENGQVMTMTEFLSNISDNNNSDDVQIFGGEVPWPITPPDDKDGDKKEENKN